MVVGRSELGCNLACGAASTTDDRVRTIGEAEQGPQPREERHRVAQHHFVVENLIGGSRLDLLIELTMGLPGFVMEGRAFHDYRTWTLE
jgi:hypothetical protein